VPTAEEPKEGNRKGNSPLPPRTEQGRWETLSENSGDPSKELAPLTALAWTDSCHPPSGWKTRQATGHFSSESPDEEELHLGLDRETAAYDTECWSCELDDMQRKATGCLPAGRKRS